MRVYSSPLFLAALSVILVPAAPRPALAAWPHDPFVNVRVAPFGLAQNFPTMVPDGAGGAIIAWSDFRNGNIDIFAQHITAAGTVAGGWPASGLAICTAASDQFGPRIVADGAGGAILTWMDARNGTNLDIYA